MKKYLAEFTGTFALVFCGTGAVIVDQQTNGSLGLFGIAATFGIIISAMTYVFGSISGAHLNPAITISLALGKLMPKNDVIKYVAAQIIGALAASSFLSILFPKNQFLGGTTPLASSSQSFSIELVLTFFLMLIILAVIAKKESATITGLIIGLVVTGIILFAGPISGGSFNPVRSLAPALITGNLTRLWIYLTAPVLGAILAMFVWRIFNGTE